MAWPTVPLTEAMLRAADEYDRAVHANANIRNTPNYTSLMAEGRFRIGHLGENALASLLASLRLRYEWAPRSDGRPDGQDVLVYHRGVAYPCEVKTCSQPHHRHVMQPLDQGRHRGDRGLIVAVRLNEEAGYAELPGYVKYRRFLEAPVVYPPVQRVRVPTRLVRLDALTPLAELTRHLDPVEPRRDGVFGNGDCEDPGPGPDELDNV
jgi:hypothetical protein